MSVAKRNLIAGAVGGTMSSFILVTPELLKSRAQMTQDGQLSYRKEIKTILKHEGRKGLVRGLSGSLLRFAPSWAINIASFEMLKD